MSLKRNTELRKPAVTVVVVNIVVVAAAAAQTSRPRDTCLAMFAYTRRQFKDRETFQAGVNFGVRRGVTSRRSVRPRRAKETKTDQ